LLWVGNLRIRRKRRWHSDVGSTLGQDDKEKKKSTDPGKKEIVGATSIIALKKEKRGRKKGLTFPPRGKDVQREKGRPTQKKKKKIKHNPQLQKKQKKRKTERKSIGAKGTNLL